MTKPKLCTQDNESRESCLHARRGDLDFWPRDRCIYCFRIGGPEKCPHRSDRIFEIVSKV